MNTRDEPGAAAAGAGPWRPAALVGLVTLLPFLGATGNGFVDFDDGDYLVDNPLVKQGLSWAGVRWAFTTFHAANWHPLTWLSHMLDAQLWGLNPAGHHLTSVLLHGLTAALATYAFALLTGRAWPSAVAVLLWALHPMRVESVAWASERKDVLAACLFAGMLVAYARWALGGARGALAAALGLFVLGLLAKPMLVTAPFVLLLLDAWPLHRLTREGWRAAVREKLLFLPFVVGSSLITVIAQHRGGALRGMQGWGVAERFRTAAAGFGEYLLKTAWPGRLAVYYPAREGNWAGAIAGLAALLLITAGVLLLRRSRPSLAIGWFWYCGMLFPVIGLVQVGAQRIADRYTHLPQLGLAFGVTFALLPARRRVWLAAATGLALAWSALTVRQVRFWRDTRTLFEWTRQVEPGNAVAEVSLGLVDFHQGRFAAAEAHDREALRLWPGMGAASSNLGSVLLGQGRNQEALQQLLVAHRREPDELATWHDLGIARMRLGQLGAAIEDFRQILRRDTNRPGVELDLGMALGAAGEEEEALVHLRNAAHLEPNRFEARLSYGTALARRGEFPAAIREFEAAVQLSPESEEARRALDYAREDAARSPR